MQGFFHEALLLVAKENGELIDSSPKILSKVARAISAELRLKDCCLGYLTGTKPSALAIFCPLGPRTKSINSFARPLGSPLVYMYRGLDRR